MRLGYFLALSHSFYITTVDSGVEYSALIHASVISLNASHIDKSEFLFHVS